MVRYLSDRIAVLYLGRLMELGPADKVFSFPHHPYTEALLSAVPSIDAVDRQRIRLDGEIPSAADPPSGCVFHTRCPRKIGEICETTEPELLEAEPGHAIRCHIPIEELRRIQAVSESPRSRRGLWLDAPRSRRPATRRVGRGRALPDLLEPKEILIPRTIALCHPRRRDPASSAVILMDSVRAQFGV